ncbi:MAG: hypothetical protein R3B07_07170 [Polyangiaceae bacterium]
MQPARQRCCYDGDCTFRGNETPTLCRYVEGDQVPDAGDVALCPQADPADAPNHWWYANDGLGGSRDISATRIGAPRLESVTPRTWQCVYPITVRRTADVCG